MGTSTTTVRQGATEARADVSLVYVAARDSSGKVLCTSVAPPAGAAELRCRFPGGAEVPATRCDGGGGVCCMPPDAGDAAQPYSVLADGVQFSEGVFDAAAQASAPQEPPAKPAGRFSGLKPFAIMTFAYLLYTTTDGAIRMIVLLHAYQLGFSAWLTAVMFSLYELAGVATNLVAGFAGSRWGIRSTLLSGLSIQLAGIAMLYGFKREWANHGQQWKGLLYVTFAQMLCGIAKDLTKLGGKTVTKLVTPEEKQSKLFKLVSFVTGFKNSMKGVGYFVGAASLQVSYEFALGLLLGIIVVAIPPAVFGLSAQLGRTRSSNVTMKQVLSPPRNVARLSLARAFLFGSRDLWFEVPLPFFLRDHVHGIGWPRPATGAALAAFIIIYGQVQSWTPQLVLQPLRQAPANKQVQVLWNAVLTVCPAGMAAALLGSNVFIGRESHGDMVALLLCGLAAFCVVFAVNSAVHSYLIVRYAAGDKVASTVGFYYMSNAVGRFVGTLCSGAIYEYSSRSKAKALGYCFCASTAFSLLSTLLTLRIDDQEAGLDCGPCLSCVASKVPTVADLDALPADAAAPLDAPRQAEAPRAVD